MISSIITKTALSALLATNSMIPTMPMYTDVLELAEMRQEIQVEFGMPHAEPLVRHRKIMVTAYSSTADQTDATPFITANNTVVHDGIVAANFLPFGTHIRFPSLFGDKEFVVADRMNERYNRRIDVWMPNRNQAKQFGKKYVEIEILSPQTTVAFR